MKLIIGNLKTNKTKAEMVEYKKILEENINDQNVIVCPQNIFVDTIVSDNYGVGGQNIYLKSGSFTGETSPEALRSTGAKYVILGHSERRKRFGETDELINEKIKAAISNDIMPILCVGETLKERKKRKKIVKKQLEICLKDITSTTIIAYEPIWAIGTGVIPTNEDIQEMTEYIKGITSNKVLYGGSVKADNIDELNKIAEVDGYLIGGASLDPKTLIEIYNRSK